MKILMKLKKFISIMTASCLLISFVIGPTAANAMTNEEATAKYKQIFKDFMLPYNYGQITSAHYAGTDRVIINIQDLHCHPKVQKNISNIIETFDKSYDVKKIYLEGVYGQISTRWITDRMDNMKRATVLDKMVETGRLTGAEYYSAISGKTEIIKGLEEKGPYLENLKRFGNIIENQDKIQLIIQSIDESVSKLKEEYYTKRQYKLDELSKKYLSGEISPQKYYALLAKHIEKLGIDLSEYENTFTYVLMLEMQKNLDYSKITTELQNLILMLKENLANSAYQMLVDNTENFSKIDKLYGYIVRISRELNLDLTVNFPNLDNYFSYIEFSQKINPLELINEEKKLTQEINTRFSETKAQREVVFLINFERYLKDYVTSKITADDYEYYKENIAQYRQLWNKYVDNKVLSLLDNYIAEADKFYKINTDRNIYFTRNMFNEGEELHEIETKVQAKDDVNKIIENMKGVKEVDIVITGGFHSQTVTNILKNHGVSYIVITPNVTDGTKLAEDTYYEIAKEQSKISFQTLATLPFSAYPEKLRIRAAVAAFGVDIAKEIFPDKIAEIDSVDTKPLSDDEKAIAQQMKKLRRKIEESKFLESDDNNFVEFLRKISDEDVSINLSEYVDLDDLEGVLTYKQVGSIKDILRNAEEEKQSDENGNVTKKAIRKIVKSFKKATDIFTSKEQYKQKQELIRKINAVNLSFFDSKLLADIREESREKFDEIKRRFEGKNLESLSLKELEDYWNLKKELLTIFEPKDEEDVKSVLEEVFADIEVFISFIGNSAPKGDYAKIALSFAAAFADELNKRLGRSRFGIISSTTTDEGSIDAISTIVAQMYDALMVYVTAIDYLKYVDPRKYPGSKDFEEMRRLVSGINKEELIKKGINLEDFLTAFKFVAENGDIYSKSVAKANNTDSSNVAVIIGGGNVAIKDDLKNAIEENNEIFLINSRTLAKQSQAPAMDHKKLMDLNSQYAVSNAVQYILNILDLFNKKAFSFDNDGHIIDINLPELEFTDEEKEKVSTLEEKKKRLAELRNKNGKNKTKEIRNLEREIDEIENSLGQLKIFYYLLKEKILVDREKYKDVIGLTEFLLNKFLELGKDIITKEDLIASKLKIHIFDMEDKHGVDETIEKEEESYKNAAEKVAKKIVEFLESHSFFKKALSYSEVESVEEAVKSEPIEREAFDLQYAKDHGYVVEAGQEIIETAGGKTTRTVYKLKDADSSKHYSKFILSNGVDGITDNFRTDAGTYTIDPMFVVYEDGSIGFMTQEDFKNIYGETKKDRFKVTKKATTVKVCFLKPRTIIQTKEGRVTVHSNEIVVKNEENNSIYAMSIEQFERIYPDNQENRNFYNKHREEINRLRAAQEEMSESVQEDQNESGENIVPDNERETIVFNKRSLRNLINSIKQKISSKKQTSVAGIDESKIVDVLEQALSEIEKNPMLVSMQTETFNDINFNVCNFKSLQNFIEDSKNKALELGNAINNFLLSAILSKDNIFTVNDHGTIRNYIHDSTLSAEEKARRLEQIKVIARLYGYISFKNEFFKQNKEGILTNNSVIKIGEQELTLYQWIHICDGHSICLNGNEIGEFASSPEKYLEKSSERAFDFAIRMNRLADVPSIKENPDILVLQDSKYIYVKRNGESEKFDVVVESIFGDLVTMYTVDGDVIKTDSGKYDISKFVENFDTQKDYIDIFVGSKNSTYSLPDGCCFKKDEEGNIFQFKNNEWKKLPVDNNGLVMLSRNAVSFDRSSGINKVTGEKLILFKATKSSPIYYYNKLDTSWYEYKDNKFVKLKDLENVKKLMKSFEINGANYYFSNSMNSMHFDSNLKSIENYDLLEHLTEINDYRVYVQYIRNKRNPNKKGQTQVLIFDELTKKWHYKDLDSVRTIEDGTKTHYIISQPIGVIITLEGSVLINIRERKAEIKQITYDKNTGKKEETSYMKLDGKWYSFKKESGTNLPLYPLVDAVDFTFDDKNYLYANKTLYEIADNDTLVETEQRTAQAFDINGIKYVNFDNKLYTMEEGNLIPVTEEQADKLKSDKQYGSLFRVLFNVVNPTGLTLSLVLQIFNTNETMKGKNVIVDEDVKITKELVDIAKREGINIVKLRIIKGQEARQRGGTLINEQSKIRMLFDSSKNELLVYSKQGINLDRNKIKDLIAAAYSEGRKDLELSSTDSDKKIITFMEKSDFVGNTTGTMLQEMIDRLEIARKAGIIKAETEIKFDLRGKKISEQVLKGEHDSTGANTFTLTRDQIDPLKSNEIEQIREKYRLIEFYEADNIPALIEFDGLQIDATGITTREQAIDILKKLQKMCNVEKTISIEFSKDIYIALADENIFSKYGVLPIANADTISIINGKKEVNKISANVNLERILDDDQVVGVIADSNSRDILSIIKGLLATKTSKYEKGLNVGLREVSSRDGKQEGYGCDITSERLKQILTRKKEIDIEDIPYLGLQEKDRKYLEYLLEKEKGEAKKEESFGFVVGIAMGTMKQKWMEKFTNIDDSSFIKEGKGQYEKGLLLLMLSMQVSGVSIDGLLEEVSKTEYDDKGWQMSAEEMYRIIGEKASVIISRVLNENDKEIKVLSDKELVRAKEDFRDLNILIQDRFRIVEATEEVKISALTVRSILAAA